MIVSALLLVLGTVTTLAAVQLDVVTIVAVIGAVTALLSAVFAGWANVKQRRTEDVRLGYETMSTALENYREDNRDLRNRVGKAEERVYVAEQRVTDLTAKVNRCEADKAVLEVQLHELQRRLGDA